ncbi:MAG: hypothetical protein AAFV25_17795 [Bacteroidota bacterium]
MKGLRSIPKVLKINGLDGYELSCLFNNGESRIIDFAAYFQNIKGFSERHPAYELSKSLEAFAQVELMGNTIG